MAALQFTRGSGGQKAKTKLSLFIGVDLSKYHWGIPFHEVLNEANGRKLVLASNRRLDLVPSWSNCKRQGERQEYADIHSGSTFTGTIGAHIEPGKKFSERAEKSIVEGRLILRHRDKDGVEWVFPVPEEHKDKRDGILVAEHPEYDVEATRTQRIVHCRNISIVENFPGRTGTYYTEPVHGITVESQAGSIFNDERARILERLDRFIGPIVHGSYMGSFSGSRFEWNALNMEIRHTDVFRIFVEVAENDNSVHDITSEMLARREEKARKIW